jgi:predicted nucleic acid-binding protein
MRYYIDTNILIFILQKNNDDISLKVAKLLSDYTNTFYVSSVVVKKYYYYIE